MSPTQDPSQKRSHDQDGYRDDKPQEHNSDPPPLGNGSPFIKPSACGSGVMLHGKSHFNPVQILIVTPFEIVGVEVRRSKPRVQFFLSATGSQNTLWMLISLSTDLGLGEDLRPGRGFYSRGCEIVKIPRVGLKIQRD